MNSAPIGVFDSGSGGLTVVRHLQKLLPDESIIYLGDTARVPYGTKSPGTIVQFSRQNTSFLLTQNVKMIVIACNSASAHAIQEIHDVAGDIPVIGMIQAGAEYTRRHLNVKHIGVIGTNATIQSNRYLDMLVHIIPDASVTQIACPLFVPLVEEGLVDGPIPESIVDHYLSPLRSDLPDALILGCTHYPLLAPLLQQYLPGTTLVDSGAAAAEFVRDELHTSGLRTNQPARKLHCFLTSPSAIFERLAKRCLIYEMDSLTLLDPEDLPVRADRHPESGHQQPVSHV